MSETRTRAWLRRGAATAVMGVVGASAGLLLTASPAAAHEGGDHWCRYQLLAHDDGPASGLIHHYVEPHTLSLQPIVHDVNCEIAWREKVLLDSEYQRELLNGLLGSLGL